MESERPDSLDIARLQDIVAGLALLEGLDPRLEEIARALRFIVGDWIHRSE